MVERPSVIRLQEKAGGFWVSDSPLADAALHGFARCCFGAEIPAGGGGDTRSGGILRRAENALLRMTGWEVGVLHQRLKPRFIHAVRTRR